MIVNDRAHTGPIECITKPIGNNKQRNKDEAHRTYSSSSNNHHQFKSTYTHKQLNVERDVSRFLFAQPYSAMDFTSSALPAITATTAAALLHSLSSEIYTFARFSNVDFHRLIFTVVFYSTAI